MITLTLAADGGTLLERLDRLYESFTALRRRKFWQLAVSGGVAVVETTYTVSEKNWHVHLHVLFTGMWVDVKELRAAWHEITGDSYIVHLKQINDVEKGIGYVTAYCSKGWDESVVNNPDALQEALVSLKGRRLYATFGNWRKVEVDEEDGGEKDWKRIERLDVVMIAAERGEVWATGVMMSLTRSSDVESLPGREHPS